MAKNTPKDNDPQEPRDPRKDLAKKALTEGANEVVDDMKKTAKVATALGKETLKNGEEAAKRGVTKSKRAGRRILNGIALFAIGMIVGGCLSLYFVHIGDTRNAPEVEEVTTLDITTVQHIVEPASALISTTYNYTDIIEFKNSKQLGGVDVPLTENHYLITYGGIIQLGINSLNDVTYEIDNTNKTITVGLPEIVIISNSLDQESFKKYEVKNSVLNETTMEETIDMEREFKDAQGNKVMSDKDVMQEAQENLKTTISLFLTAADETSEYEVIFK